MAVYILMKRRQCLPKSNKGMLLLIKSNIRCMLDLHAYTLNSSTRFLVRFVLLHLQFSVQCFVDRCLSLCPSSFANQYLVLENTAFNIISERLNYGLWQSVPVRYGMRETDSCPCRVLQGEPMTEENACVVIASQVA